MPVLVHAADLHLSANEEDYSFAVLKEIVELAAFEKVDYLLFTGDLFNSFEDAALLRGRFRECINNIPTSCEVVFLTGNHESLGGGDSLGSFDFGRVTLVDQKPFSLLIRDDIEFLGIPHQNSYPDFREWKIPLPEKKRIALLHGEVAGISFSGPGEEGGGAIIDPSLFSCFRIDYAALGHIHKRRSVTSGNTLINYPGSARVWRRGEEGAHGVYCLSIGREINCRFYPLKQAGEYKKYFIPLGFDGHPEFFPQEGFNPCDWIELELSGIVEDEHVVTLYCEALKRQYSGKVRKLNINREGVAVFSGIASSVIARRFIEHWKRREPQGERERRIWLSSRDMGLREIKRLLEAER